MRGLAGRPGRGRGSGGAGQEEGDEEGERKQSHPRLVPTNVRRMLAERPWEGLPPELAPAMRPGLGALAEEMIDTIRATVPAYARPLEGAFAEGVRAGVEGALSQFLDVIEEGHAGPLPARELYADLGRGEAREGRSLEALLAAYRIGARVAWRRAAERARELGMDDEVQALLAESIFAYMDELSAVSAEGFAREQSAAAGELDRRRGALARLLVQSPPADPAAVELAARDARRRAAADARRRGLERGGPRRVAAAAGVARRRRVRAHPRPRRARPPRRDRARVPLGRPRSARPCRGATPRAAPAGRPRRCGSSRPTAWCSPTTT